MMSEKSRQELKARCQKALMDGFQVAHAAKHVAELTKDFGSVNHPKPGSTEHLVALLEGIEAGAVKKTIPAPAPTPVPAKIEPVTEDEPVAPYVKKSKKSKDYE